MIDFYQFEPRKAKEHIIYMYPFKEDIGTCFPDIS